MGYDRGVGGITLTADQLANLEVLYSEHRVTSIVR